MIGFVVPGTPVAKGRPRFAKVGGFVRTYTPKETSNYESKVALFCSQAYSGRPIEGPVLVKIRAYFPIPKTTLRKAEREKAEREELPMSKKPDADNIIKSVLDGMQKVAFVDDSQVYGVMCFKIYSKYPRVEVIVEED
jgi:Holliday junction resolvase RusA-like endonuclease